MKKREGAGQQEKKRKKREKSTYNHCKLKKSQYTIIKMRQQTKCKVCRFDIFYRILLELILPIKTEICDIKLIGGTR